MWRLVETLKNNSSIQSKNTSSVGVDMMDVIQEDPVQEGLGTVFKQKREWTSNPTGMMPPMGVNGSSVIETTFQDKIQEMA